MNRRHWSLPLLLLLTTACTPQFNGIPLGEGPTPELALTDQHGEPFRLSDQHGRVVLLFFGFVHCPDVCPMTLSSWGRVQQALGDDADQVRFVFVTVDPERDTPERLAEHVSIFGTDFRGLGGTAEELQTVYSAFGIHHQKVAYSSSALGYVVDHTSRMFLVDSEGALRFSYPFDIPHEELLHDVRLLLPR